MPTKPRKSRAKPKDQLKKPGRKSQWSDDTETLLLRIIGTGCSLHDACDEAGISFPMFQARRVRDLAFADRVKKARVHVKVGHLASITRVAHGRAADPENGVTERAPVWQASAWWLERVFPEEFGRRHLEVTGENGGPVSLNVTLDLDAVAAERLSASEDGRELLRQKRYVAAGEAIPPKRVGSMAVGGGSIPNAGPVEPGRVRNHNEPGPLEAGAALRPHRREAG